MSINIVNLKKLTQERCLIKAVGGIKNINQILEVIEAGASFIGTSLGTELLNNLLSQKS